MPEIVAFDWRTHIEDVLAFQKEIYETNFPGVEVDRGFLRDYRRQLRKATNSSVEALYVLQDDDWTCGFLWVCLISTMVAPCIGYIKNIYVRPELRGQGYGKQLIEYAEQWCLDRGVDRLALDASCCNETAIGLYRKMGFQTERLRMTKRLKNAQSKRSSRTNGFFTELRRRFGGPLE